MFAVKGIVSDFGNLENPLVLPLTRCAHAHTLHWSDVQQANRTYTKAHITLIGVTTFFLLLLYYFFLPHAGAHWGQGGRGNSL